MAPTIATFTPMIRRLKMYTDVVQWNLIREKALKHGISIRQISCDTSMHKNTVRKILKYECPPGRQRRKPILHRKLGRHTQYIHTLLEGNKALHPSLRLTIQRIFEELRDKHGYDGSYSSVRDYIRKNGGDTRHYIGKARRYIYDNSCSTWEIMYDLLTLLPKKDMINTLHLLSNGKSPVIAEQKIKRWLRSFEGRYNANMRPCKKEIARREARAWMKAVLQKSISREDIRREAGDIDGLQQLLDHLHRSGLNQRNRALCVLAEAKGIPRNTIYAFLDIHKATGLKYINAYKTGGVVALYSHERSILKKADDDAIKQAVFTTLHEPPSLYGINRTTWKIMDLVRVLGGKGVSVNKDVIRQIIKDIGFKWRKARTVLTSKDPAYREKLDRIQNILRDLQADEAFFSIDEYGPFAVKMKGGRKLVGPTEEYTVPQWQKSRGSLIITAALELSGNQVIHFYSDKKNTDEMIKLTDILVEKYGTHNRIWLSWDAASWHISKKLYKHIGKINEVAAVTGGPLVDTAPLPSGAQFLNVIESIFSGMARSIIHNSDYISVYEAKIAIDRYFGDRNEHFFRNPRRAGKKIWGQERVISGFEEANNCKDPAYR